MADVGRRLPLIFSRLGTGLCCQRPPGLTPFAGSVGLRYIVVTMQLRALSRFLFGTGGYAASAAPPPGYVLPPSGLQSPRAQRVPSSLGVGLPETGSLKLRRSFSSLRLRLSSLSTSVDSSLRALASYNNMKIRAGESPPKFYILNSSFPVRNQASSSLPSMVRAMLQQAAKEFAKSCGRRASQVSMRREGKGMTPEISAAGKCTLPL